jgi:hypothetical protein
MARKQQYIEAEDLDRKALAHRRALGFRDDQSIDGMTLITKLKARYPEFNYLRVPDGHLPGREAQWDSDKKLLTIPESVFRGMNRGVPRDTMTVVHEVAHALLGHKGTLHRAPVGNLAERFSANIRRMELQAKRYAAAFLMPDTSDLRKMSEEDIAKRYGVSREAALIRKSELK